MNTESQLKNTSSLTERDLGYYADDTGITLQEAQEFVERHKHIIESNANRSTSAKQQVIDIIRDWVLDRTEQFAISDIYAQPHISARLACTHANMHLIDEALIALRCTTQQDHNNTPMMDLRYIPPVVRRVERDMICL